MWMKMLGAALVAAVLSSVPNVANACSCTMPDLPNRWYNSDFVFTGKVVNTMAVGSQNAYLVRMDTTYKDQPGDQVVVTSSQSAAACGITFTVGEKYLFTGYDDGTRKGRQVVAVSLCGHNFPVASLSQDDRDFLAGREVCGPLGCVCGDGTMPVSCFVAPCQNSPGCVGANECVDNYCGGCNAEWWDSFAGDLVCVNP